MQQPATEVTAVKPDLLKPAVLAPGRASPAQPGPRPGQEPSSARSARWLPVLPALTTLAVTSWRISGPSFWRDEAATLSAAHRPFPALIRLLGHMDAVHGAYYMAMWLVVRVAGSSELVLRLPSALAMAAAAGLTTALGRRLVSPRAGLLAGLAFAGVPAVSWFAQDARPFAAETAAAAAASYLFVQLADGAARRQQAAWYAASLVLLGLANVFGLLLIPAHAVALRLRWRDDGTRAVTRAWLIAAAAAGAAFLPLAWLDWTQRDQLGWLHRPGLSDLLTAERLLGTPGTCLAGAVLLAAGLTISARHGRSRVSADWPGQLLALALPWLLLPPALLLAVSQLTPVYAFRYIVFCIPAAALLLGAGLAAAGRAAAVPGLAVLVLLGLPGQLGERGPAGHCDDIRGVDQIVAAREQPGDAVLYPQGAGTRSLAAAYPFGLARLRDVMLAESPVRAGTISGTDAAAPVVRRRLTQVSRAWVIEVTVPGPGRPAVLGGLPFRLAGAWQVSDLRLWLYQRDRAR